MSGHLLQPSVAWIKALQQTEPSSFLSSCHALAVVVAQSVQAVHVLAQSVQAVPGLVQSALVTAQKSHDVLHGVHRVAQISWNVYAQIPQIWIYVSWMMYVSW